MNYYKVILDNKVIDVLENAVWIKLNRNGRIVICSPMDAVGVVSSDGTQKWNLDGTAGIDGLDSGTVVVTDITETEAAELKTLLGLGGEITNTPAGSEVEFPEETQEPEEEITDGTLEEVKKRSIERLSAVCQQVIFDGFDVVLSDGNTKHFTLKVEDQLNLLSLSAMIATGATSIPYHASGELCEYYSAEDMTLIVTRATEFKTYHTSYFNSLKNWVGSMDSIAEVGDVAYGDPVPAEFCSVVLTQLMQAQEES